MTTEHNINEYRILKPMDLDAHFRKSESSGVVILNKIDYNLPGYAEQLQSHMYSQHREMTFYPSCDCGMTMGEYYLGARCTTCGTEVKRLMISGKEHLPHSAWIAAPDDIPGFLHPRLYLILSKDQFRIDKNTSYIDVILNPLDKTDPPLLRDLGITGRGFTYFHDNFEWIMEQLLATMSDRKGQVTTTRAVLKQFKHCTFVRHLPILASALHTITSADGIVDNGRRYTDKESQHALDAVHALSYLEFTDSKLSEKNYNARLFAAYQHYITYIEAIVAERMARKNAIYRRHIMGFRAHFTLRSVIVPLVGQHRYDELHMPWVIGVCTFRDVILGKLMRHRKMTLNDALLKYMHAQVNYDEDVHAILNGLIDDAQTAPNPEGLPENFVIRGIPILFNRNPSIRRGATQLLFITKFKTRPTDKSIGMSCQIVAKPNADYDGDELNGIILTERDAIADFFQMHPSMMVLATGRPEVGTDMVLPKQGIVTVNSFLGMV
jgi:hypothetical protein